nr:helix-turn-helix transcriptional regulator [uncultured Caproiciproducens sp.]
MSINFKIIGLRIRELRLEKQMSQADLAEKIDMSPTYMSHIETAKRKASLESLLRISNALEITMDRLLNGNQTSDSGEYLADLLMLLDDCTSQEKRMIFEIAWATKKCLRDNRYCHHENVR